MGDGKIVLIVDDAKRFDGHALFEPEYTVHRVSNRKSAMAYLCAHPDVTVTLINLEASPEEELKLLASIRRRQALQSVIVWICLAPGDEEGARSSYEAGADELVYRAGDGASLSYQLRRLAAFPVRYGPEAPVYPACCPNLGEMLRENDRNLAALINAVPGGIAMYDMADGPRLMYSNDVLSQMAGYDAEEYRKIMETDFHGLIDPRDRQAVDRMLASYVRTHQHIEGAFRIITRSGAVRWVHASAAPVDEGALCTAVFIDVTREKENEARNEWMRTELNYRTEFDSLTGLSNRETFYRKTAEMLHAHADTPYVVLVMDIDRFRVLNDMLGKETGDRVLVTIADELKRLIDESGTYARMESDHFAACFPQNRLDMPLIMNRLDQGLKRQNIDFHVQLSYGIYQIRNINVPVNHMCDRAVMAMKTIKGSVVNRYAFYDDKLRQTMLEENAVLDEMNNALEQGQFKPYLQPVFSVDTQKPVSVEMLVRWDHPEKGLILPGQFIPLFERNGFITKLDFYIWERACELLKQWKAENYLLPISVNISRMDLYFTRLSEHLLSLVHRYDIDPSMLRLEITESAYSRDPDELVAIINRLRSLGFVILMDDFGSGYSSLNVLMDMPVDILKLDMRFLSKLNTNPRASSILTSVVRMAKWLNMPIVAEGVETMEQLSFLRSIGCDHMQGYLLSKPIDVESYTRRFMKNESAAVVLSPAAQPDTVDLSRLWDVSAQADALFSGMIGAIGIYELDGDVLEIRRVNDGYYELFGCTPKQVFDHAREALSDVHPDDREGLLRTCRQAAQSGRVERYVCRHIHYRDDREVWLEARLRFLGKTGMNDVFCFIFNDITEQKEFEQARVLRNYAMVLRSVYSSVFELNLTSRRMRTVHAGGSQEPAPPGDQPWRRLKVYLHRTLLESDEELEQKVFTKGYLRKKLKESRSDYYLLERRVKSETGAPRWASFTFIPMPTDAAEEIYLLCIADVDSRKRADELLMENQWLQLKQQEQARYQTLLEHLGTTLFEWDAKTGQFTASHGLEQYALSEFDFSTLQSQKQLEPYIYAKDLNLYWLLVNDILAHGNGAVTLRLTKKNGDPVWCRVLCSRVLQGLSGEVRYIAAINQIDEQMKIRANYLDEQSRFQAFAENFLVGLGIFEMRGEEQSILYLSGGYRRMVGYDENEHFYDEVHSYSTIHPEDVPRFREATRNLQRTGRPFTIDYRVYHKDGRLLWMRSHNSIYPTPEPGVSRIFAVIEEITELKTLRSHLSSLLSLLPVAVGIYDLTETPVIDYENNAMRAVFGAPAAPEAPLPEGEPVTPAIVRSRGEFLALMKRRCREGRMEIDEVLSVVVDGGPMTGVRLLATAAERDERLECYCVFIEVTPAS